MKLMIYDTRAVVVSGGDVTSGMIGRTLELEFSSDWDGLGIIACFTAGTVSKDVYVSPVSRAAAITIPWECLQTGGVELSAGFYGTRTEEQEGESVTVLAIPTVYKSLGIIRPGAVVSGETAGAATPTAVQTMLTAAATAVTTAQSVRDDADDGVFDGEDGTDGHSPVVTASKSGKTTTVSVDGTAIASILDGDDGQDGEDGTDGKSAYQAAVEGGYTGTEAQFNAELSESHYTEAEVNTLLQGKLDIPATVQEQKTACDALGAVYDGQYELIETITLTEAVASIVRTQDTQGNAYNFKDLYIRFQVPAQPDMTVSEDIIGICLYNSENVRINRCYPKAKKKAYNCFGFFQYYCRGFASYSIFGVASNEYSYIVNCSNNSYGDGINTNVTKIVIEMTIPSGTTIQIYGVRA